MRDCDKGFGKKLSGKDDGVGIESGGLPQKEKM